MKMYLNSYSGQYESEFDFAEYPYQFIGEPLTDEAAAGMTDEDIKAEQKRACSCVNYALEQLYAAVKTWAAADRSNAYVAEVSDEALLRAHDRVAKAKAVADAAYKHFPLLRL